MVLEGVRGEHKCVAGYGERDGKCESKREKRSQNRDISEEEKQGMETGNEWRGGG